jgi:hypothetical protein
MPTHIIIASMICIAGVSVRIVAEASQRKPNLAKLLWSAAEMISLVCIFRFYL